MKKIVQNDSQYRESHYRESHYRESHYREAERWLIFPFVPMGFEAASV